MRRLVCHALDTAGAKLGVDARILGRRGHLCRLTFGLGVQRTPAKTQTDGWWGNSAVALSYEGLAWVTGAAIVLAVICHLHRF